MRSYLSGLVVAVALLTAQPAAAEITSVACSDLEYDTCCNYQAVQYYDSCYGWQYYFQAAPANYVCNNTDRAYGAPAYGTYACNARNMKTTCPVPQQNPETVQYWVTYNAETGDYGFDKCAFTNGNYTRAATIDVYRSAYGMAVPTTFPARATEACQRTVSVYNANGAYYTKKDNFVSLSCSAKGALKVGDGPAFLVSANQGSKNKLMYLCLFSTRSTGGGSTWSEYRVLDSCSGGSTIETLGYARIPDAAPPASGDLGGDCSASNCMGECGQDCNGILGFHVQTGACMQHDNCVCNNGGNIWAWDCLGDFALAAVSFVFGVATQIIQSIIEAIGNAIDAILDFLFGWL